MRSVFRSYRAVRWSTPYMLVATFVFATPTGAQTLRDSDVVARVNGVPIYRKTVREVVQGGVFMQDSEPDAAGLAKLAEQALESLVDLELLYQESQARGTTVSDADVEAEIKRTRTNFPSDAAFKAALEKNGTTLDGLRADTRKTLVVTRWLEGDALREVRVSAEEIRTFYEQNREEFRHDAQVRASHILVRATPGSPAAQRTAARKRAEALLAELRAGADFGALAREKSEDPVSAARGGDRGFFSKGEMDQGFETAAFALTPGQATGVVETRYGFEIITVTDRRDAGISPLAEVEPLIREVLLKSARQERHASLIAALRNKARIERVAPLH